MIEHVRNVRYDRTSVKGVDYVPGVCDNAYMANGKTTGEMLLALKERADLSLENIAERAGYRGKSSVQEYFKPEYEGPLGARAATKLAKALEGTGSPPIVWDDVISLAASPTSNARPIRFEGASAEHMAPDLPIYGTALGAEIIVEGEAIEQTTLNKGEVIGYAKRPVILNGNPDVYGLHVQGSSMDPVHPEGAFIVAQKDKPLRIGDDVVVYLRPRDETDDGETARTVLVKRLVRRTAQYIELRQFTPDTTFRIATIDVLRTDRVLTLGDLLS
jgi:SOS-response transcriptional repressor LexA